MGMVKDFISQENIVGRFALCMWLSTVFTLGKLVKQDKSPATFFLHCIHFGI